MSFDPKELSADAAHTAPFMTSLCRRPLGISQSTPNLRGATIGCRPHAQGSMPDCVALATQQQLSAIPGYMGHIRGKTAGNIYALTTMLGNEAARIAVDCRERPSPRAFYQSTMKTRQKAWQHDVAQSWREACGGLTHQEGRHGQEFRNRLHLSENIRAEYAAEKTERDSTLLRTWAGPQPELEKQHNMYRSGTVGYQGHQPEWRKDRDLWEKRELGKVHPVYLPRATAEEG